MGSTKAYSTGKNFNDELLEIADKYLNVISINGNPEDIIEKNKPLNRLIQQLNDLDRNALVRLSSSTKSNLLGSVNSKKKDGTQKLENKHRKSKISRFYVFQPSKEKQIVIVILSTVSPFRVTIFSMNQLMDVKQLYDTFSKQIEVKNTLCYVDSIEKISPLRFRLHDFPARHCSPSDRKRSFILDFRNNQFHLLLARK